MNMIRKSRLISSITAPLHTNDFIEYRLDNIIRDMVVYSESITRPITYVKEYCFFAEFKKNNNKNWFLTEFEESNFKNWFFNYIQNKKNLEETKNVVLNTKKYVNFEINSSDDFEMIDSINSFFVCSENKNQVVETKNAILNVKKYNVFLNLKKYILLYKKNRFLSGSTMLKVESLFDYVKRYITAIKSYFDYFMQRKYKFRTFAT